MIITLTSKAWYDAKDQTLFALPMLEDALQPALGADYGGLAAFHAVLVAMEPDEAGNAPHRKTFEKVGRFPGTDLRFLSVSVGFSSEEIVKMTGTEVARVFAIRLKERLADRPARLPKAFDYPRFHADISQALDAFIASAGACGDPGSPFPCPRDDNGITAG
ncbi:hypothetical protein SGCZBJ_05185 [Caulobacter zeae]|uniref:Uncharacterized protein n=1 Tax=Caulobacter zeae TaxID=2055137 RepID=A0A2N5DP19_9CAUL|nr:hypothetical protein [Caulobacter zeae]PLR27755.1 hypothetical protein SGCZBJ_05185 [Caulobacter zeae]